jgi:transferrin receptor
MKLAADEEENADNNMKASVRKPKRFNGRLCFAAIALVIFFLIGKNEWPFRRISYD